MSREKLHRDIVAYHADRICGDVKFREYGGSRATAERLARATLDARPAPHLTDEEIDAEFPAFDVTPDLVREAAAQIASEERFQKAGGTQEQAVVMAHDSLTARREHNAEMRHELRRKRFTDAPAPVTISDIFSDGEDGPGGSKIKPEGRPNHYWVLLQSEDEPRLFVTRDIQADIQEHLDGYPRAKSLLKAWRDAHPKGRKSLKEELADLRSEIDALRKRP